MEKGLAEVVKMLVTVSRIDINARATTEISAARPLHVAILHGQSQMIPGLILLGADVNVADEEKGCTPLMMATILQDAWAVRLLLRAGADPLRVSREGRSAMYVHAFIHLFIYRHVFIKACMSTSIHTSSHTCIHAQCTYKQCTCAMRAHAHTYT